MAWAKTVEVVVPSPAMSLVFWAASLSSCAPMFSKGSSSSISFATETPSWVMVGKPTWRSIDTLRPFGPRVAETAFATTFMPFLSLRRASSENTSCLAAIFHFLIFRFLGLTDDAENVTLAQDEQFLAIDLDLGA